MQGGIDYSGLYCNHHNGDCGCVGQCVDMVMVPDSYPTMRHFVACMEVAFEREAVRLSSYMSDILVYDRNILANEDPSLPFAYCVRPGGTHLVRLVEHDGVGHMCYDYPRFVSDSFGGDKVKWYWWDGEKMTPLDSYIDACRLLREECDKRDIKYWKLPQSERTRF